MKPTSVADFNQRGVDQLELRTMPNLNDLLHLTPSGSAVQDRLLLSKTMRGVFNNLHAYKEKVIQDMEPALEEIAMRIGSTSDPADDLRKVARSKVAKVSKGKGLPRDELHAALDEFNMVRTQEKAALRANKELHWKKNRKVAKLAKLDEYRQRTDFDDPVKTKKYLQQAEKHGLLPQPSHWRRQL